MSHGIDQKEKLLLRTRRVRWQIEAIESALECGADCEAVMHLLAGARAAMARLMARVVEDQVLTRLVDREKHPDAFNAEAAEDQISVVRSFLK